MKRRNFVKAGTLTFSLAGGAGKSLAFLPDGFYENAPEWPKNIPFRKSRVPRTVREEVSGFLWLDAADFSDYGGWALDTQFVAFMGSSYLIAHGTSAPVEDALTTIQINTPGVFRLWVRSKNWIPEQSPGKFSVAIDGQESDTVFGTQPSTGVTAACASRLKIK